MMTSVMVSQAGAYYDPQKQRFYMPANRMLEMMRDALYSHELHHALQDQYFDLSRYMAKVVWTNSDCSSRGPQWSRAKRRT